MAPVTQFQDGQIVWRPRVPVYGALQANQQIAVDTSNTDVMTNDSIIVREADGAAALHVAGGNVLGIIEKITSPDFIPFRAMFKASGEAATIQYLPINLVQIALVEDGVGGVIADPVATPYVNLVAQTTVGATGRDADAYARGERALRYIDSSTANASSTGLSWQIVAQVDTYINQRRPGDTTTVKAYWLQPVAANEQTP